MGRYNVESQFVLYFIVNNMSIALSKTKKTHEGLLSIIFLAVHVGLKLI